MCLPSSYLYQGEVMSTHYQEHGLNYVRSEKGWLTKAYSGMKQRSTRRGHELPQFSKEALQEWCKNQTNYVTLFHSWAESGYLTKLKPSIDRKKNSEGYSFSNMRLTTFGENQKKDAANNAGERPVYQYEGTKLIGCFKSVREASRQTGITRDGINRCCNGKRLLSGGYAWKYNRMSL